MTVYRLTIEPTQKDNDRITFNSEQKNYLYRVLRLQRGDRFIAIDGRGGVWNAEIEGDGAKIVDRVLESNELTHRVTLIAALPKGNGFDDVVRACTELGVAKILPIVSQRTLLKPKENKIERWRKIATEAAEQSERQIIPAIEPIMNLTEAISSLSPISCRYICLARGNPPHLLTLLSQQADLDRDIIIAIGCEGGWTDLEENQALNAGFIGASLGKRVLRAVTAPLAALAIIASTLEK